MNEDVLFLPQALRETPPARIAERLVDFQQVALQAGKPHTEL